MRALTAQGSDSKEYLIIIRMRALIGKAVISSIGAEQIKFAELLLSVGDGTYPPATIDSDEQLVSLLKAICVDSLQQLITYVFGTAYNPDTMRNCALLAPKNDIVCGMNNTMLDTVSGDPHVYLSADEMMNDYDSMTEFASSSRVCANKLQLTVGISDRMYTPIEVIHSTTPPGMPLHRLELKVGIPIIVLRNINQGAGICSGTRCIVKKCYTHTIYAEICK